MIAVFLVCLLSWTRWSAVEAEPPPPQKLTVLAINTNYTLRWDYKQSATAPNRVVFTTEFISKYKLTNKKKKLNWTTACKESQELSCDLTNSGLFYLTIYQLRVRASANGNHSAWALKEFCPENDAEIGPPSSVKLDLTGATLEIVIDDPMTSTNSSMREHVTDLSFNIRYWEQHGDDQALITKTIPTNSNVVVLPDLKPLTWYCVMVQSHTKYYNRISNFTLPLCRKTEGHPPCWQIILIFLASLVIVTPFVILLAVGSFKCSRFWKSIFHPQLPSFFFIESLRDPTALKSPQLIPASGESELLCDMIVCLQSPEQETHSLVKESAASPSDPNPESRLLRQSSSGSTDSGVYSTGGTSGTLQLKSTSAGVDSAVDFLPVKIKNIEAGLNSCLIFADEGINEM